MAKVTETFKDLLSHIKNIYLKKFYMGIIDSMLAKYGAVMIGYAILGLPVFSADPNHFGKTAKDSAATITKNYVKNSHLLVNLAKVYIFLS